MKSKIKLGNWVTKLLHYEDFPNKGICFFDMFSVLRDQESFKSLIDDLLKIVPQDVDCVIAIDSRGFLFGPLVADKINAAFVPVRKMLKLPGPVYSQKYTLEYGQSSLEIQKNAFEMLSNLNRPIDVVIIDDLIATGGSLNATVQILKRFSSKIKINIKKVIAVIEIEKLNGCLLLQKDGVNFASLLQI